MQAQALFAAEGGDPEELEQSVEQSPLPPSYIEHPSIADRVYHDRVEAEAIGKLTGEARLQALEQLHGEGNLSSEEQILAAKRRRSGVRLRRRKRRSGRGDDTCSVESLRR